MKSVHIMGLGMVVGAMALGAMVSIMTFNWQSEAFPASGPAMVDTGSQPSAADAQAKALFDSRCASCHTIGGGNRVGPDLRGIANRRSHEWIVEFIYAPDQVIARGDPTALQLLEEYGTPMPNMGVSRAEAEALAAYISSR